MVDNKTELSLNTRFSWFLIWVSDCCSSAALASTAALRSLSRRSASSWAIFLSFSSSSALRVCSSSSEQKKNTSTVVWNSNHTSHYKIHTEMPVWYKLQRDPEIKTVLIYQTILLILFNRKKSTKLKLRNLYFQKVVRPSWALFVWSSICLSLSISSMVSRAIFSVSFSAYSRFFFSLSNRALTRRIVHKYTSEKDHYLLTNLS